MAAASDRTKIKISLNLRFRAKHGASISIASWQGLPIDPDASAANDEEQNNCNDFGCRSLLVKGGSHVGIKKSERGQAF